jgi:hypothetical protein
MMAITFRRHIFRATQNLYQFTRAYHSRLRSLISILENVCQGDLGLELFLDDCQSENGDPRSSSLFVENCWPTLDEICLDGFDDRMDTARQFELDCRSIASLIHQYGDGLSFIHINPNNDDVNQIIQLANRYYFAEN